MRLQFCLSNGERNDCKHEKNPNDLSNNYIRLWALLHFYASKCLFIQSTISLL